MNDRQDGEDLRILITRLDLPIKEADPVKEGIMNDRLRNIFNPSSDKFCSPK